MRAGRVNNVTAQGDSCRGTRGNGAAVAPSHGLEHPGLGTLSQRAEQDAGQGGVDRGDVTRGKQSGQKHGDRRAGSRSGYQETQADKGGVAGGAGTGTTTVQTSTRPTASRQRPQDPGK